MYIGEIIKKYRETNNLSQREFAKRTSLSPSYINTLEKIYNPKNKKPYSVTMDAIVELAKAMNMSLEELINVLNDNQSFDIKTSFTQIPLLYNFAHNLDYSMKNFLDREIAINEELPKETFGIIVKDSSMLPLLDEDDIAIVCIDNNFTTGSTYLIMHNNIPTIRKVIKLDDGYELHAMNIYYPTEKVKEINIIGRVIRAENKSAFK